MSSSVKEAFSKLLSVIISNKDTLKALIIALVTIGVDQIIEVAAFRCPCIMESDLLQNASNATNETEFKNDPLREKMLYSYSFIFAPFIILLLIGICSNKVFRRHITGCCVNFKCKTYCTNCKCQNCFTNFLKVFGFALVAPIVWLVLSFLDGDYYACGQARLPYRFKINPNQTCADFAQLEKSDEYYASKRASQVIGWIMAVCALFLVCLFYIAYRCVLPMTHTQLKLNRKWRSTMEESLSKAYLDTLNSNVNAALDTTSEDPNAVFNRLKQENDQLKENFWKNLEQKLGNEIDATNFKLQPLFENAV